MKNFTHEPPANYSFPKYLKRYLRNRGVSTRSLSRVPVELIREAQIDLVFENMESIMLSPSATKEHASSPALNQMLVTRIGSCDRALGHYIPRPEGTSEIVMHFCISGEGWLRTQAGLHRVQQGESFLIPPNEPHAYGSSDNKPWSILWIHCQGKLVEELLETLKLSRNKPICTTGDPVRLKALHAQIFHQMERRHTTPNLITASSKLFDLLAHLISEQQGPKESTGRSHVDEAIAHMEANLHNNLTLKEMARAAGISPSRFSYLFKQAEGISPSAYFTQRRMQQAGRYLLSNQLSISEVSRKMGYDDPYYFSRAFKLSTGKSPRDYRKTFQE